MTAKPTQKFLGPVGEENDSQNDSRQGKYPISVRLQQDCKHVRTSVENSLQLADIAGAASKR